MSLIVLAPKGNQAFRDEVRGFDWQIAEQRAGVHRISGSPFSLWLVETDVMAELGDPLLSLVSRVFLKQHRRIMKQLQETGRTALLCYALQLIDWFRSLDERLMMTHSGTPYIKALEDELQRVHDAISSERRMRGLSAEELLRGLSAEEVLQVLTDEQIVRLRELLDRSQNEGTVGMQARPG